MANKIYLGLSGLVSHPNDVADKYNKLLDYVGAEGMLIHIERMMTTQDFKQLIREVENNLFENGIEISEDFYTSND